jgi:hypothetical protein
MTRSPGSVKGGPQGRPAETAAKRRPLRDPVRSSATMHRAPTRRGGACPPRIARRTGSTYQMSLFLVATSGDISWPKRGLSHGHGQLGHGERTRRATESERRSRDRCSMCPYKRPYNSGTIRIRLLPSPSVTGALTCGKRPVGYCPGPSLPAPFRFPNAFVPPCWPTVPIGGVISTWWSVWRWKRSFLLLRH